MEARSLASLNLLAANPPSYPVNPTEQAQEPLVLYLARVPGTRDVILSPFKPQLKNVTAEDVASSLYYVHLELHSTDLSTPAPIHNDAAVGRSSEDSNSSMTIRRKPLPPHARPITPESMLREVYPPPNPEFDHPPVIPTRSPQRQSPSRDTGPRPASPAFLGVNDRVDDSRLVPEPLKLARKPAGRARAHSDTKYLTPGYGEQSSTHDTASTHHHHRNHHHHQPHHAGKASFDAPRSTRSPSPLKASSAPTAPFTLTLIRRDPSSGQQWNVGQISSQQLEALEDPLHEGQDCYFPSQPPSPTHAQLLAQPPIDVRIETSGYAKFRNRPSNRRAETGHDEVDSFGGMFARRIAMSYSKSWTSNLRDKLQDTKLRHQRAISAPSTHSLNSEQMSEGFAVRDPTQGMRPRGYVFRSPWDGRCEFRTGNGGRSLRCHHLLHDGKSAAYNPLVAEQTDSGQRGSSSVVSELRFNLPSSEVLSANYDKDDKPRRLGHFSKFFRSSAERGDDSYDDDDDAVSPFDVNLGRERAGGGNRGKRAKLGKLIIYNDGLKMLDLLVATNIGLWWLTWEKSF